MIPVHRDPNGRGRSGTFLTTLFAGGVAALLLTACGSGYGTSPVPTAAPVSTLALSPMPPAPSTTAPTPLPEPTVTTAPANTVELGRPLEDVLATVAAGNRALLIGDSVMRSATPSYGGDLCEAMKSFGWSTVVSTRSGADTSFATTVLDETLNPAIGDDYDAVAIFLGPKFGAGLGSDEPVDVEAAIANIDAALTRLAPRPVLLVTVTPTGEHRTAVREFNRELAEQYKAHPNIAVLDWATISTDDPAILNKDGISLTKDGVVQLGLRFAAAFGAAPEVSVAGGTVDVTCEEREIGPGG